MAEFAATTVSNRDMYVAGNKRIVTGSVIVTTAATSDDTVFCGLSVITHVTGQWLTSISTVQLSDLQVFPSTVSAGGIRVLHATTMNNVPIAFRAEGR